MLTGMDGSGRLRASGGSSPGTASGECQMCPRIGASPCLAAGCWSLPPARPRFWGIPFGGPLMARGRMVLKRLHDDQRFAELSTFQQAWAQALIVGADDWGRVIVSPPGAAPTRTLALLSRAMCRQEARWLRLASAVNGAIDLHYWKDSEHRYICFPNWHKWQRLKYLGKPKSPPCPECLRDSGARWAANPERMKVMKLKQEGPTAPAVPAQKVLAELTSSNREANGPAGATAPCVAKDAGASRRRSPMAPFSEESRAAARKILEDSK